MSKNEQANLESDQKKEMIQTEDFIFLRAALNRADIFQSFSMAQSLLMRILAFSIFIFSSDESTKLSIAALLLLGVFWFVSSIHLNKLIRILDNEIIAYRLGEGVGKASVIEQFLIAIGSHFTVSPSRRTISIIVKYEPALITWSMALILSSNFY